MTRFRTDQIRENPSRPRHPRSCSFAPLEKCPDISCKTGLGMTSESDQETFGRGMKPREARGPDNGQSPCFRCSPP